MYNVVIIINRFVVCISNLTLNLRLHFVYYGLENAHVRRRLYYVFFDVIFSFGMFLYYRYMMLENNNKATTDTTKKLSISSIPKIYICTDITLVYEWLCLY